MSDIRVTTGRLELIAATPELIQAELENRGHFAELLNAHVPESWPPPLNDSSTMSHALEQLQQSPDQAGWWKWYFVCRKCNTIPRVAIGTGGFKGKPSDDGMVEVGYSLLPAFQNRGYAMEAVDGLIDWAFQYAEVNRVIAQTLTHLHPSIRVLHRNRFTQSGEKTEEDVLMFELPREVWAIGKSSDNE